MHYQNIGFIDDDSFDVETCCQNERLCHVHGEVARVWYLLLWWLLICFRPLHRYPDRKPQPGQLDDCSLKHRIRIATARHSHCDNSAIQNDPHRHLIFNTQPHLKPWVHPNYFRSRRTWTKAEPGLPHLVLRGGMTPLGTLWLHH